MNKKLKMPYPGEFLKEAIDDLGVSQYRLAKAAHLPHSRVTGIIKGEQRISVVTALKLARVLNTTPEYWLNMQRLHDVRKAMDAERLELAAIEPLPELAALAA